MMIFHILSSDEWRAALAAGTYAPAGLLTEGFIHLCHEPQLLAVADRYFRDRSNLLVLAVREESLVAELRREPVRDEIYPHLYGALNLDAVTKVVELSRDASGAFVRPLFG